MSFQGFVDGKDIDRLGPDDFRTVMNRIAEVEALRNRIALSKIDLSTRNNDADEGLDGRVHWPADVVSDIFVSGENALQHKAGKLKPNTLKKEIRKRGVRDILARGGGYVICVGHDYNPTAAQKWRRDLRKLATNRKLDPNRFKIMFGSEIGRIASQFPSVIVLPELRKDIPLIVTVANWSEQHKLNWTPDGPRLEIIERIRSFLQDARLGNVLRITSIVLKYFADEHYLAHTSSPEQKVLFQAAQISPKESWNLVGPMLSRMDSASHRLLLALGEAYGELIPTDVLVQWAREHLPYGPGVVAKLVAIKSKKLPERARTLLRVFKGNKYVQSTIAAHLSSGSWMGPFSGRLKYELDIAEGWVTDPEPSVRLFAKTLVKGLKQRLNRQEMLEEEGHI